MESNPYNKKNLLEKRRNLRLYGTSAEVTLWRMLKGRQILGVKFRRQFSVDCFILDFYCPAIKLGIELDGNDHFTLDGSRYDEDRAAYLKDRYNIDIIRFENKEVFDCSSNVLEVIRVAVEERLAR